MALKGDRWKGGGQRFGLSRGNRGVGLFRQRPKLGRPEQLSYLVALALISHHSSTSVPLWYQPLDGRKRNLKTRGETHRASPIHRRRARAAPFITARAAHRPRDMAAGGRRHEDTRHRKRCPTITSPAAEGRAAHADAAPSTNARRRPSLSVCVACVAPRPLDLVARRTHQTRTAPKGAMARNASSSVTSSPTYTGNTPPRHSSSVKPAIRSSDHAVVVPILVEVRFSPRSELQ